MMKPKNILFMLLLILFILFSSSHILWALEKETHEFLNKQITLNYSILNNYLKDQLGFTKGIGTTFIYQNQSKTVEDWIGLGGKYEDEPMYTRSLNHFHDPLKTWDIAGYKGTSKSSILWAHEQGIDGLLTGGDFAWKDVREYFYTALTGKDFSGTVIAYSQAEKEIYYGATFRGIGQLMHLVEDMSVPAHTRDDAHVVGYHYEEEVNKIRISREHIERTRI